MRSELRLKDLRDGKRRTASKLMNVKIPTDVSDTIHTVASQVGASKIEVVIALLNEGFDVSADALKGWKPPKNAMPSPKTRCSVKGCGKAYVAKGYCTSHYQAARRGTL